jgi:hypothetical protein
MTAAKIRRGKKKNKVKVKTDPTLSPHPSVFTCHHIINIEKGRIKKLTINSGGRGVKEKN